MYRHLLIPTDGSAMANAALDKSLRFASEVGAQVTVLTVTEPFQMLSLAPEKVECSYEEYDRYFDKGADDILNEAGKAAQAAGVVCTTQKSKSSDPARTIVDKAAEQGCDLIAMASHGREGFKAFMLGSVTMKVLANSQTPVLVYR